MATDIWRTEPVASARNGVRWWMYLKPDDRDRSANRARVVSWAAALAAGLAKWNALGGAATGTIAAAAKPGLLTQVAGSLRQMLLPWLASTVIVLAGVILALLWIGGGASAGFTAGQLLPVIISLAIVVLARVAANVNRLAMHDFYRWRLADAFATTREAAKEQDLMRARQLFAEAAAARLSTLAGNPAAESHPGLVICGTANMNAAREAPPGRGGFCITFDPDHVVLHRENGLQVERAIALTADYEALVGQRRFTLFRCVRH